GPAPDAPPRAHTRPVYRDSPAQRLTGKADSALRPRLRRGGPRRPSRRRDPPGVGGPERRDRKWPAAGWPSEGGSAPPPARARAGRAPDAPPHPPPARTDREPPRTRRGPCRPTARPAILRASYE